MSKAVSLLLMVLCAVAMPYAVAAQCDVAAMHASSVASRVDTCASPCCPAQDDTTPVNEQDGRTAACALRCDVLQPAVSEIVVAPVLLSVPTFDSYGAEPLLEREQISGTAVLDERNDRARSFIASPLRT